MEIKSIEILNLPHRVDKKAVCLEWWFSCSKIHEDKVNFFPAIYGNDYSSKADIVNAAIDDGAKHLSWHLKNLDSWMGRNSIAYMWSAWKLFNRIASFSKGAYIYALDDRVLPYGKEVWHLEELLDKLPNFKLLQLNGVYPPESHRLRKIPMHDTILLESGVRVSAELLQGEGILVVTPEAAQWMVKHQTPYDYYEWVLYKHGAEAPDGFYCLPFEAPSRWERHFWSTQLSKSDLHAADNVAYK